MPKTLVFKARDRWNAIIEGVEIVRVSGERLCSVFVNGVCVRSDFETVEAAREWILETYSK